MGVSKVQATVSTDISVAAYNWQDHLIKYIRNYVSEAGLNMFLVPDKTFRKTFV